MTYQELISKVLNKGFEEAEVYANVENEKSLSVFKGKVESFNIKKTKGVSIRALKDGKMVYAYTESLEDADVENVIGKLCENVKNLSASEPEYIFDGKAEYEKAEAYSCDAAKHSMDEKIALLKALEKKCYDYDPKIFNVEVEFNESKESVSLVNSKGVNLEKSDEACVLVAKVCAQGEDEVKLDYAFKASRSFEAFDLDEIAEKVCTKALDALGAGFVQTAAYPVVFSNKVATQILSSFASTFTGTAALKKTTMLASKLGEKVFGDNVSLIDDPMCAKAFTKQTFDDEGVPCKKVTVVDKGVFNAFLHNQKTATYFKAPLTGNGFKAGNSGTVEVSPRALYLEEGSKSKEEIFAGIKDGIYVTSVAGIHAGLNPASGDFNLQSTGFRITDGKLGTAVTLFVVSGNFFEMMKEVEEIGNDIEEDFTGRVVSPTLYIKSLKVSGK